MFFDSAVTYPNLHKEIWGFINDIKKEYSDIDFVAEGVKILVRRAKTDQTGIGMLKAIGASDWNIRHIFIYNSLQIILGGLFWGNLIAVTLSLLQIRFNFLKLDEAIYFMDFVPINIELFSLFLINLGTIIICYLILVIPSAVIAKISPAKSIKFE